MTRGTPARALLLLAALLLAPRAGGADDLPQERLEWSVLPALGGNTDVGLLFGAVSVLARFDEGFAPYHWRGEAIVIASAKEGPAGAEFPLQRYLTRWDLPGQLGGRLRIEPQVGYQRVVNSGYFGIGNASRAEPAAEEAPGVPARRYQYVRHEGSARVLARLALEPELSLALGLQILYDAPEIYEGSKLAEDLAAQTAEGARRLFATSDGAQFTLLAGLLWDTRDHETVPTRGFFHELSVRFGVGAPASQEVRYGGFTVNLRFYASLVDDGWLVLATRVFSDHVFGNVPFYELGQGGAFPAIALPGGSNAIRGVPTGRYAGRSRIVANVELRTMFARFSFGEHRFRLGAAAFADAGRIWSGFFASDPDLDGHGLGVTYGVGGGLRLQWGQSVLARIDLAYSPDAGSGYPSVPLGVYLELGQAF